MEYVYPAIFHPNDDASFTIVYPDLPGCVSEGKSLENAIFMAKAALEQWLKYLTDKNMSVPDASRVADIEIEGGEFVNLIRAELRDKRAVKRTVSIPKWMDDKAKESGLSLSRILQDALSEKMV